MTDSTAPTADTTGDNMNRIEDMLDLAEAMVGEQAKLAESQGQTVEHTATGLEPAQPPEEIQEDEEEDRGVQRGSPSLPLLPPPSVHPARKRQKQRKAGDIRKEDLHNFGLVVAGQSPSGVITAVACQFCKHQRMGKIKMWGQHTRRSQWHSHHERMHPKDWEEYQKLSMNDKLEYFTKRPSTNSVITLTGGSQGTLPGESVVQNEIPGVIQVLVEKLFDVQHEPWRGDQRVYDLIVRYLQVGLSFTCIEKVWVANQQSGLFPAFSPSMHRAKISLIASGLVTHSFHILRRVMSSSMSYGLALDPSCLRSSEYLDLRLRPSGACRKEEVDLHLASIPIDEIDSQSLWRTLEFLLSSLDPNWRTKLLSLSTDGEAKMTGRKSGLAARVRKAVEDRHDIGYGGFFEIWCSAHQVDLAVRRFFGRLPFDFDSKLAVIVHHFRQQYRFSRKVGSQIPAMSLRWSNHLRTIDWLLSKSTAIMRAWCNQTLPDIRTGNESWFMVLPIVRKICFIVNERVQALQRRTLTLSEERTQIGLLQEGLKKQLRHLMERGDFDRELINMNAGEAQGRRDLMIMTNHFVCPITDIYDMWDILCSGYFNSAIAWNTAGQESWRNFRPDTFQAVQLGEAIMNLIHEIGSFDVLYGEKDSFVWDEKSFPVVPKDLSLTNYETFNKMMNIMKEKVDLHSEQDSKCTCERIKEEFWDFHGCCLEGEFPDSKSFFEAWDFVPNGQIKSMRQMYPQLFKLSAGMATMFPTTATVESDFSVLKREKNVFRHQLGDLPLAGIMHSKQFHILKQWTFDM